MISIRFLASLAVVVIVGTGAGTALACSLYYEEHELDPGEVAVDTTAPEVVVDRVTIEEGRAPERTGACSEGTTSCDDIGSIRIEIETVSDDRTEADLMGYRVIIDGDAPGNAPFDPGEGLILRARDGVIRLDFVDPDTEHKNSWDFSLRVIAVDLAGNESEPTREFNLEQEAGCRADDGGSNQAWLFAPFVPWLWSRRRRSGVSDNESLP